MLRSKKLARFLKRWPGEKYLGIYKFMPVFFALGALLEFSMIKFRVGEVNFCTFIIFIISMTSKQLKTN